ncbi:MAG: 1-acyl-sn-glycerol-3-phosphate acyltransferase [Bacteroidales bacterium]|nr:1-acyl-sn-glycerol-3-phosphate acyltransferase [Candidatus Cacconaster scatequi]
MKRKKEIYEKDFGYELLHRFTALCVKLFYRKVECEGQENIPGDGAVIFAPNHCNAMMDPMAILNTYRGRVVFVARADIFGGVMTKIFEFLKMMPINRRRDGIRNMVKAEETIEKSIEVLNNDVPFCILAEGTHRTMHSLLPIGKGIARIAAGFCEKHPGRKVYIVPVGLEYGDYFRPGSTLSVRYGSPVDVSALLGDSEGGTQLAKMNEIRSLTGEGIKKEIIYLPDDDRYEPSWELVKVASGKVPGCKPALRGEVGRKSALKLVAFREENPEGADALLDEGRDFARARKKAGISLHSLSSRLSALSVVLRSLLAIVLLPVVAVCAVAAAIPLLLAEFLCHFKFKDRAFHNSARFLIMELIWPLCFIIGAVVLLICNLPLGIACALVLWPAPYVVYRYVERVRRLVSSWKLLSHKELCNAYDNLYEKLQ